MSALTPQMIIFVVSPPMFNHTKCHSNQPANWALLHTAQTVMQTGLCHSNQLAHTLKLEGVSALYERGILIKINSYEKWIKYFFSMRQEHGWKTKTITTAANSYILDVITHFIFMGITHFFFYNLFESLRTNKQVKKKVSKRWISTRFPLIFLKFPLFRTFLSIWKQ